jgi:signal transduction histidine kinase
LKPADSSAVTATSYAFTGLWPAESALLPIQVVGDVARRRQVLLNLVGNAIKFTEKGAVAVIAEQSDDENEVRLKCATPESV